MIYEIRTYTTHPGKLKAQLDIYEKHGLPVIARHFGYPVIVGVHQDGDVNSYVHAYAFDSHEERARRQAAVRADPELHAYQAIMKEQQNLVRQESRILVPPPFFRPGS